MWGHADISTIHNRRAVAHPAAKGNSRPLRPPKVWGAIYARFCSIVFLRIRRGLTIFALKRCEKQSRMDTKELIQCVAERIGRSESDSAKLVEGLSIVLKERLSELDSIAIPGFGTFEAKKKDERIVNNPSNGKRMLVPPRVVVNFKVSNVLKSKLK